MLDAQTVRSMNNETLHRSAVRLAAEERKITQKLLLHLREIEKRRLYLDHKSSSLHDYCTRILKYSESSASRRVNAARLLESVPEVSEKVVDGSVNLSNLSMAQTFIKAEEKRTKRKMSPKQKRDVVANIENVSQDQAFRNLSEALPEADVRTSSTRPLQNDETLIKIVADPEFMKLYERVRELNSHNQDFLEAKSLFKALMNEHLDRHAPERKNSTQSHAAAASPDVTNHRKTYYSNATEKALYERSGGQCEHKDHNGHRCSRRYHLQIDHIVPLARGGTNDISNLQHLCRAHNFDKGCTVRSPVVMYSCG